MTVTYLAFAIQEQLQTNVVWVDTVLHRLMPMVVMADWLMAPPHGALSLRKALVPWIAPPLVWTTFTLIRGEIDG